MKSFKDFLIEAQKYEEMFNAIKGDERWMPFVQDQLAWAKKVLKKNDRIVWFLRMIRIGILKQLVQDDKSKWESAYQKAIAGADNAFVIDAIDMIESGNYMNSFKRNIEHYLSLGLKGIDEVVWAKQNPTQLYDAFLAFENEWKQEREGHIPYLDQPLEGEEIDDEWGGDEMEPIIDFGDGYYWLNTHKPYCRTEGDAMGHCGNSAAYVEGDNVLSLRKLIKKGNDKSNWLWYPCLTFILHKSGKIGEMKGRGNTKPEDKYHPYIIALMLNPIVTGVVGGGYAPERNFSFDDLTDEEKNDLFDKKPSLMGLGDFYKKFGMVDELFKKIEDTWADRQLGNPIEWMGDKKDAAIIERATNLEDFIKDNSADRETEWIGQVLADGRVEDVYEIDNSTTEEIFKDYFDEAAVAAYIRDTYDLSEEDYDDRISDMSEQYEFLKDEDDEIINACERANFRGVEDGIYEDVTKHVRGALDEIEIEIEKEETGYTAFIPPSEMWKENIPICIVTKELISLLSDPDLEEGYGINFSIKIEPPYYGFSGFSDEGVLYSLQEDDIDTNLLLPKYRPKRNGDTEEE
jgi:hypothetical protein